MADDSTGIVTIDLENGMPISYSCKSLVEENMLNDVEIDYYFEMAYLKGEFESTLLFVDSELAQRVAEQFRLLDGGACIDQPDPGKTWLVEVGVLRSEGLSRVVESCTKLAFDSNEACEKIHGKVHAKEVPITLSNSDQVLTTVVDTLQSQDFVTGTEGVRLSYVGTTTDCTENTGRNNLPPLSAFEEPEEEVKPQPESSIFTPLGVVLTLGLVLAFIGIVFMIVRRRMRAVKGIPLEDDDEGAKPKGEGAIGISRLSDSELRSSTRSFKGESFRGEMMSDGFPDEADFDETYTFDMGDAMKNELMGIHGIGASPRVRQFKKPRSTVSGDPSDSSVDSDSWAQTDATLGSLEMRLEPVGTAEV